MADTVIKAAWRTRITHSGKLAVREALANPLNFRLHPSHQRQALEASLDRVGWVQQVVVNTKTGNMIDGHLRLALAEQRGESELPCLYVDLSEDEERLVLASLDPIAAMATADRAKLQELLTSLESEDETVRGLLESIARQEHIELPAMAGLVDPDEVPEPPVEPVSKAGDLWLCGDHRLLCGDSTKADDVGRLMAAERASLMVTDPPYLVDYDGGNHPQTWGKDGRPISAEAKTRHWDSYADHNTSVAFYEGFLRGAIDHALSETPLIYMFFGMMRAPIVFAAWKATGLLLHEIMIWRKSRLVLGRCDYCWNYEPFAYGWIKGKRPEPARRPPANATTVWEIPSTIEDGAQGIHATMKSVELIRRPITYHTTPGELIFEPFSGSGTAIIAAETMQRRCYALELAPQFVDVGVIRWQNYTGRQATLEGDGRSFAEIAAERRSNPACQTSCPDHARS